MNHRPANLRRTSFLVAMIILLLLLVGAAGSYSYLKRTGYFDVQKPANNRAPTGAAQVGTGQEGATGGELNPTAGAEGAAEAAARMGSIRVLEPKTNFPPCKEIQLARRDRIDFAVLATGQYGEVLRAPSPTGKYEVYWVPQKGEAVAIVRELTLAEPKVLDFKPEEHLGLVRVKGDGKPKKGISVWGGLSLNSYLVQECATFGEIMVVPAGTWRIYVDDQQIKGTLKVEPGKLHEVE